MQIKPIKTKDGAAFEFVRWSYDPEQKRSKSTSLGRMKASWNTIPEPVLAKMNDEERGDARQFLKEKVKAERLHMLQKSPGQAVEILTACIEYFKLPKDEKSENKAVALCGAMESLYAVFRENGYLAAEADPSTPDDPFAFAGELDVSAPVVKSSPIKIKVSRPLAAEIADFADCLRSDIDSRSGASSEDIQAAKVAGVVAGEIWGAFEGNEKKTATVTLELDAEHRAALKCALGQIGSGDREGSEEGKMRSEAEKLSCQV